MAIHGRKTLPRIVLIASPYHVAPLQHAELKAFRKISCTIRLETREKGRLRSYQFSTATVAAYGVLLPHYYTSIAQHAWMVLWPPLRQPCRHRHLPDSAEAISDWHRCFFQQTELLFPHPIYRWFPNYARLARRCFDRSSTHSL